MWEGKSLVEGLLVFRVNKEETVDDAPAPMFLGEAESATATPPMLLLRDDVAVEGRDGIGGGGCAGGKLTPSLLLKLKLRALFVPLQILLSPDRAGSGGASSALPASDSEVLPCCFFLNAKSYMSPNIPAKVFRRFFIVSSASSTTELCDWVRPGAPPVPAVDWDRLAEEVVED